MSLKTKFLLPTILLVLAIFISGCGQKKTENSTLPVPGTEVSSDENYPIDLVKPTGNIDDAVRAIADDADSEKSNVTSEENEALESINDSQETNDFGQSYDENEF